MKEHIQSVQYLRGLAALLVVLFHAELQVRRLGYEGWWPQGLGHGVDIFFVISGFIMWSTTSKSKITTMEFYKRRIIRILPLYWIVTTFVVCVALLFPQALQSTKFGILHVISSYLFFPFPNATGEMFPILVPGWTLNYEMLFYVIFGACLVIPRVPWRFAIVVGVFVGLSAVGYLIPQHPPNAAAFWTNSVILEFAFGMFVAAIYGTVPKSGPISIGIFVLGLASFFAFSLLEMPGYSTIGVAAALVVLGAISCERAGLVPVLPIMQRLGDSSYSLYLTHALLLSALGQVWRRLPFAGAHIGIVAFIFVAVALSLALGWLTYRYLELPLLRSLRRRGGLAVAS
jgi:peptidoglycan/LPS O-acetylase OafA/YrhL